MSGQTRNDTAYIVTQVPKDRYRSALVIHVATVAALNKTSAELQFIQRYGWDQKYYNKPVAHIYRPDEVIML